MKKIVFMLLISAFLPMLAQAGQRDRQKTFVSIPCFNLLDATTLSNQPGGISTTATSCVIGTATGCSQTCLVVPASTDAAFVTTFRVPNDYKRNGKFYLNGKAVSVDTTAQFRLDIQVQEMNNITSTAVTVGTASTAFAAANASQWREVLLDNGADFGPSSILSLYVARSAGTTAAANVFSLVFWYEPQALVK